MNTPPFLRRFTPLFLLAAGLLTAFPAGSDAAQATPTELRNKMAEVLQAYREARNQLVAGKGKTKSKLLYKNKLTILNNKIKYLETEYARQGVVAADYERRPSPKKGTVKPVVPMTQKAAAQKNAAKPKAPVQQQASKLALTPIPVSRPTPTPLATSRPMGQQFAVETASVPRVVQLPIQGRTETVRAQAVSPSTRLESMRPAAPRPSPVEMSPVPYARAFAPAPAQVSLKTPSFSAESAAPGAPREAAVRLPEPEPIAEREPAEKPAGYVTAVPAGMPSFTGKDWVEMDPTYKTLHLLSIMGRLINYDIIAWKSQSFYARAIDEAIAKNPSLQSRNVTWIFFDQLEIHEPDTREAVDKIRRSFN